MGIGNNPQDKKAKSNREDSLKNEEAPVFEEELIEGAVKEEESSNASSSEETERCLQARSDADYALEAIRNPGLVRRLMDERNALLVTTDSEAHKIIKGWQSKWDKKVASAEAFSDEELPQKMEDLGFNTEALVLPPNDTALVGASLAGISKTPFEDYRKEHGLDRLREALYRELDKKINLSKGFSRLRAWLSTFVDKDLKRAPTPKVAKYFPNLSAVEIAFLGLLSKGEVPDTYLLHGTAFDSLRAKRRQKPTFRIKEDLKQEELKGIPAQLALQPDGIVYGTDRTCLCVNKVQYYASREEDSRVDLALRTNKKEILEYHIDVLDSLRELVLLQIDRADISKILFSDTDNTLPAGIGLVLRTALNRIKEPQDDDLDLSATEEESPPPISSVKEQLSELDSTERDAFEVEEQLLAERLIQTNLRHDDDNAHINLTELVNILGVLDEVPSCLLQEEPFSGSIMFYGNRVLFACDDGVVREEVYLQEKCQLDLKQNIFAQQFDGADVNQLFLEIERELIERTEGRIGQAMAEKIGEPLIETQASVAKLAARSSYMEAVKIKAMQLYGIDINVAGSRSIEREHEYGSLKKAGAHVKDAWYAEYRIKFGKEEAEQIMWVLERVGPIALKGIKSISKHQVLKLDEDKLFGSRLAEINYNLLGGELCLKEPLNLSFSQLADGAKSERPYLIAYGIGLKIWEELDHNQQLPWLKRFTEAELNKNDYLNDIARNSPTDDFASHFAFYICALPEFEGKAQGQSALMAKLDDLAEVAKLYNIAERPLRKKSEYNIEAMICSLRIQYPNMPDLNDTKAMLQWIKAHWDAEADKDKERYEGCDDDYHEEDTTATSSERDQAISRAKRFQAIRSIIYSATEGLDEIDELDEVTEAVIEVLDGGSDEIEEEVVECLEDHPFLRDHCEDLNELAETIVAEADLNYDEFRS